MTEQDALDLMEMLYPYFIKKYKEDNSFKNTAQIVNATYISSGGKGAKVQINPYDTEYIYATVNTTETLNAGDSVLVMYSDSLKNARIIAKN